MVARCDSTNTVLFREKTLRSPVLLAAEEQTAGRGRRGRRWHGTAGRDITFSLARRVARPARELAAFPQQCLRNDRLSARRQHGAPTLCDALAEEFALGRATLASGEAEGGARRFVAGAGKHGRFEPG